MKRELIFLVSIITATATALRAPPQPPGEATQRQCDDGTMFTCLTNSTHCVHNSPVYCNFSVDLVKELMQSYDSEIATISGKLDGLEAQRATVERKADELREVKKIAIK